jgi:hypothetical protein
MKFWTLTALTLVLALAAGTAQAQSGVSVKRTIHLASPFWEGPSDIQGRTEGGEPKGKLSVGLEVDQEQAGFGEGSSFQLDLRSFSCPGAINWAGDMDLSRESRTVWVLYLTVGDDGGSPEEQRRRIITFRPNCSSFGTTWAQTQINGFLVDASALDGDPWNGRVMTDSLLVEVFYEVIDAVDGVEDEKPRLYFTGFSPAVQ